MLVVVLSSMVLLLTVSMANCDRIAPASDPLPPVSAEVEAALKYNLGLL